MLQNCSILIYIISKLTIGYEAGYDIQVNNEPDNKLRKLNK
jgi:hypothetical protein